MNLVLLQEFIPRIKEAREAKKLSIAKASNAMRIDEKYLQAIEDAELSKLPQAYERMFIKSYMKFLGIDTDENLGLLVKAFEDVLEQKSPSISEESKEDKNSKTPVYLAKHLSWIPIVLVISLMTYFSIDYFSSKKEVPEEPLKEISLETAKATIDTVTVDTAKLIAEEHSDDSLRLDLHILEPVFIFAKTDSLKEHKIAAVKFKQYQIKALEHINLYIADGSKVNLTFNDSNYGVLTPANYKVNFLIFTKDGLIDRGITKREVVNDPIPVLND